MKAQRLKKRQRRTIGYYTILTIMSVGAILMLFPTIWMILCSFKTQNEMYQMPPTFLPKQFDLDNFISVFKQMPFARYYLNSVATSFLNMGWAF